MLGEACSAEDLVDCLQRDVLLATWPRLYLPPGGAGSLGGPPPGAAGASAPAGGPARLTPSWTASRPTWPLLPWRPPRSTASPWLAATPSWPTGSWTVRPRMSTCSARSLGRQGRSVPKWSQACVAPGTWSRWRAAPESTRGEFARLTVKRGGDLMNLDLARDWRQLPAVATELGPVLGLDDAGGSKVTAMIRRGLPRDYIDVGAATAHYTRADLITLAVSRDPGLRVVDSRTQWFAWTALGDRRFAEYGLDVGAVAQLRSLFVGWPRTSEADHEAEAVWQAGAGGRAREQDFPGIVSAAGE